MWFSDHASSILQLAATVFALFPAVRGKKGRLTMWGYGVLVVALVAFAWNFYQTRETKAKQAESKSIAIDSLLKEMAPQIALYRLHREIGTPPPPHVNQMLRTMTDELEKKFHLHYDKLSNRAREAGQLAITNQRVLLIAAEMKHRDEGEVLARTTISLRLQEELASILCKESETGAGDICARFQRDVENGYQTAKNRVQEYLKGPR